MTDDGKVYPSDAMTSRQRLLAAYRGEPVDRIPFWAKIINANWRAGQPAEIARLSDRELLDFVRADGLFYVRFPVSVTRPRISVSEVTKDTQRVTTTHTPDGDLVERWQLDPQTQSWHPVEFPIKTLDDVKRFRWRYEGTRLEIDESSLAPARNRMKEIDQRGVGCQSWGTSPLMNLVEHVIGPVNTTYLLMDYPREMEDLMDRMHAECLARVSLLAERSPVDVLTSLENTSTTLISPEQFNRYCLSRLCDYGRAIESAGKIHELHMCGHTLALLEKINTIPASAMEAFTSPTLGNTRLVDGRTKAPTKTLIGGTNAMTWLLPADEIKKYIESELGACPDHRRIVLTTAGVCPQGCGAEKLREVSGWLSRFAAKA